MKKATIYSLALFIIVFALADVSILQAYHGNESLGILPTHHTEEKIDCEFEVNSAYNFTDLNETDTPFFIDHQHNSDTDCPGESECLASCSHIIICYFVFNTDELLSKYRQPRNPSFQENTTPKSEPADIFHPPKAA